MKLRLASDTIRIRVRKSDIGLLQKEGRLLESIALPAGPPFEFAVQLDPHKKEMDVSWEGQRLTVWLPAGPAGQWIDSEQVGMEASLPLAGNAALDVVVEKDFPCQHQPTTDPSDTFHELAP
ncbi:MAG: hypothetical protein H6563_07690 [Lewinellaceae bacterium]|nr:hypothetical protein [Lewinellaceae bacterium]